MIIAKIGQRHDGSFGTAHAYIDAIAKTAVDALKFQTHIAVADSFVHESFRHTYSRFNATRIDF